MPLRPVAILTCTTPQRPDLTVDDRHRLNTRIPPRAGEIADLLARGAFDDMDEISLDLASHPCTDTLRLALENALPHSGAARRLIVDLTSGQTFTDYLSIAGRHELVNVEAIAERYRDRRDALMPGATLRLYCLSPGAPDLLRQGLAQVLNVEPADAARYLASPGGIAVSLTDISRLVVLAATTCAGSRLRGGPLYRVEDVLGTLHIAVPDANA